MKEQPVTHMLGSQPSNATDINYKGKETEMKNDAN